MTGNIYTIIFLNCEEYELQFMEDDLRSQEKYNR